MNEGNEAVFIGERLYLLRNEKKVTQEQLAEQLGVSRQAISKWESDKAFPGTDKLIVLADYYDTSLDYILRGKEEKAEVIESVVVNQKNNEVTDFKENQVEDKSGLLEGTEETRKNPENQLDNKRFWSKKNRFSIALTFVLLLTGIVTCIYLVANKSLSKKGEIQSVACIDKVYDQFTKARVSVVNEAGEIETQIAWIDTAGVREGDYVFCYLNENGKINIEHGKGLVVASIFVLVTFTIFLIQIMEVKRKHEK